MVSERSGSRNIYKRFKGRGRKGEEGKELGKATLLEFGSESSSASLDSQPSTPHALTPLLVLPWLKSSPISNATKMDYNFTMQLLAIILSQLTLKRKCLKWPKHLGNLPRSISVFSRFHFPATTSTRHHRISGDQSVYSFAGTVRVCLVQSDEKLPPTPSSSFIWSPTVLLLDAANRPLSDLHLLGCCTQSSDATSSSFLCRCVPPATTSSFLPFLTALLPFCLLIHLQLFEHSLSYDDFVAFTFYGVIILPIFLTMHIFDIDVQIGGRQYIVFLGRFLYTQRLKGANVDDKIILNKVLLVGTKTSTYIGKPVVPNATVHAVVEEQGLDPKVVVFKYKKKKNYRRNIGHRQPNTRIWIVGITGYQDSPASPLP
ncbi:hypothetical protein LXL04_021278 [Taraxacum kok-saghyz]